MNETEPKKQYKAVVTLSLSEAQWDLALHILESKN